MSKTPIFIHSLFRTGSTYLFNVFRRSTQGYWCYQEPLHELAVFARNDPSRLFVDHGEGKARMLRHPLTEKMYFQELHDVWPAWKDTLSGSAVYDGYFAPPNVDIGISYWRALIDAAKGRPVFQECRTAGRVAEIKEKLGGVHIYLWRNPWDQWWSYKVSPYFDIANQLIINAPSPPPAVRALRADLNFQLYASHDLHDALAHFSETPPTSEESYLAFYLLWCLGLKVGTVHAHQMLNIDSLSASPEYRAEMARQMDKFGIRGINFDDCHVPQGTYMQEDRGFFSSLEDRVHYWLRASGWSQDELDNILVLRQRFAPVKWGTPVADLGLQDLAEQSMRAQTLARRYETEAAKISRTLATLIAKLTEAETRVTLMHNSRSWKITAPMRVIGQLLRRYKSSRK